MERFALYPHHVAISDQSGDDLVEVYHLPQRRVHLIYNGIPTSMFRRDRRLRTAFREAHGIPADAMVFGVAGKLVQPKGFSQLIAVLPTIMALWQQASPQTPLYFVAAGVGMYDREFSRLAIKLTHHRTAFALHSQNKILSFGMIPQAELPAFYNALDVFVVTTLYYQGLDMVLQEAVLCGAAPVVANVGSLKRTVVPSDDYGAVFDVGDHQDLVRKLMTLMRKPSEVARIGTNAMKRAQKLFTREGMTKSYSDLFYSLLDSQQKDGGM
jgi:glycosyltransferase involved in cell wall biosynthesis